MKTGKPFALNETGQRENNEDAIFPPKNEADENSRYFLVCDGMGGHENGEVASNSVCDSFAEFLKAVSPNDFDENMFDRALDFAFNQLDEKDDDNNTCSKMGTTLAFLYLNNKQAFMAHIGDSRIYHFRKNSNGEVRVLYQSSDHSLVNELLKAEIITEEEAENHPKKNMITRVMQPHPVKRCKAEIHITEDVKAGDFFFLCSDGITESLTNNRLCRIIEENTDNEAIINTICALCKKNSNDNYSAWLAPVMEGIR